LQLLNIEVSTSIENIKKYADRVLNEYIEEKEKIENWKKYDYKVIEIQDNKTKEILYSINKN
jgi:hypothetical protein